MFKLKTMSMLFVAVMCFGGCAKDDDMSAEFEPIRPALEMKVESPDQDPTVRNAGTPDPDGQRIRQGSRATLEAGGFCASEGLPTAGHRAGVPGKLRPIREVALRLMAIDALFTWVNSPEDSVSSKQLNGYVERNGLREHLTDDELEILALSRMEAHRLHNDTIGWHLENMWALAWVLGFDPPPDPMSGQIPNEISRAVVLDFLPGLDASVDDLLKAALPRSTQEVVELEDLFYCAHNAVRSAQTGSTTSIPRDFHPVRDGGAIHERRQALTWAISPGVAWEATDLST